MSPTSITKSAVWQIVDVAITHGMSFMLIITGSKQSREAIGLPSYVCELEPLLLKFPAEFHQYVNFLPSEDGLRCDLSFDALYRCAIPWSLIDQVIVVNPDQAGEESEPGEPTTEPVDEPIPQNVISFSGRRPIKQP